MNLFFALSMFQYLSDLLLAIASDNLVCQYQGSYDAGVHFRAAEFLSEISIRHAGAFRLHISERAANVARQMPRCHHHSVITCAFCQGIDTFASAR
jgi:hypothetical protein